MEVEMDWWLILLIFLIIVIIVWWALSRQTSDEGEGHHEAAEAVEAAPAEEDLTKIEGIGPKVQGLLYEAGIKTYAQLAAKTPEELDAIMDAAGSIYKAMDETSWPKQAALAAAGDWEALEKLQDELVGGR
jgi:predicted flap endonuclease-1-like 5' DNA nuclease